MTIQEYNVVYKNIHKGYNDGFYKHMLFEALADAEINEVEVKDKVKGMLMSKDIEMVLLGCTILMENVKEKKNDKRKEETEVSDS